MPTSGHQNSDVYSYFGLQVLKVQVQKLQVLKVQVRKWHRNLFRRLKS
jgi:hypothetical protein